MGTVEELITVNAVHLVILIWGFAYFGFDHPYIMKHHQAMHTQYRHDFHQTKVFTNVHYVPIRQTYCSPNVLRIWYTHSLAVDLNLI